jgi:HEAT repeat protein
MDKLGGGEEARKLIIQEDAQKQLLGVRLMELFASDEQLPLLEAAARESLDERVRAQAIYTLGLQKQTPLWEALMVRLLESPDEKLRSAAIKNLSTRYTDSARKALRDRLPREPWAQLRPRIEAAIKNNVPR